MHDEFTLSFESCFVEIVNLISSKEEDENKKNMKTMTTTMLTDKWFWKILSKLVHAFTLCCYYLPFEKSVLLHLKKILLSFTKQCFVYLVEIVPVVLEEKIEI